MPLRCFNPCFNGSMYKNPTLNLLKPKQPKSFNPCFNGSMYKNNEFVFYLAHGFIVSILVLMDLCIKTSASDVDRIHNYCFNPCFNGSMYKNTIYEGTNFFFSWFQSLF